MVRAVAFYCGLDYDWILDIIGMVRVLIPVLGPFTQNGLDPLTMVADAKDQSCDCSGS